jgi:cytochrome c-type biogenesis protein
MDSARYCIISIFVTVALLLVLSATSASEPAESIACAAGNPLTALTLSAAATVFAAGLLAGFNPCLLAMLAFLASTTLSSRTRRSDILIMVAFFTLGTFAVYILFGVGLLSILQDGSIASTFRFALAAIILIMGLMQLEDARRLHSGGESIFRVDWTKKYVHGAVSSRRLGSYFLLGALFSLVRAPCVGGIYIAIIGVASHQGCASSGLFYLLIYNLGIALPVLFLGGIMALGTSPEQVDQFRQKHRVAIRLITGITLLALAPLIYWQLI